MYVLKLVLRISFKFIPDIFYKGPGIATIFTDEILKFFLGDNNIRPFFLNMSMIVYYSTSTDTFSKKRSRERAVILFVGSSHITMIFTLLAKPIAI